MREIVRYTGDEDGMIKAPHAAHHALAHHGAWAEFLLNLTAIFFVFREYAYAMTVNLSLVILPSPISPPVNVQPPPTVLGGGGEVANFTQSPTTLVSPPATVGPPPEGSKPAGTFAPSQNVPAGTGVIPPSVVPPTALPIQPSSPFIQPPQGSLPPAAITTPPIPSTQMPRNLDTFHDVSPQMMLPGAAGNQYQLAPQSIVSDQNRMPAFTPSSIYSLQPIETGNKGLGVQSLQQGLQELGFFPTNVQANGVFGAVTKQSVQKLQAALGMKRTGIMDRKTTMSIIHGIESGNLRASISRVPIQRNGKRGNAAKAGSASVKSPPRSLRSKQKKQ